MEFSHADKLALRRAEGWMELRLPLEANEELEEIQPAMRAHPDVLKLRHSIYATSAKWDMALEIANCLHQQFPNAPYGAVQAAVALLRLGRPREAKELSLPLVQKFPKNATIPTTSPATALNSGRSRKRRSGSRRRWPWTRTR